MVSRVIGFSVRMLVLIAAGLILLLTAIFGMLLVILWPLVPPAVPILIVKGLLG